MSPADDVEIGFTGARFGGAPRKRRRKPADETPPAAAAAAPTADDAVTAAMPVLGPVPQAGPVPLAGPVPRPGPVPRSGPGPLPVGDPAAPEIGFTGARFGGAPRRGRRADTAWTPETPETAATPEQAGTPRVDPARMPAPEPAAIPPRPVVEDDPADDFTDERAGRSLAVRPYFYTRGRTRSRYELAIETLVSTPPAAFGRAELAEQRGILELCREPRSIAEIAALAGMPLGVARVVVGDLAVTGGLDVHETVTAAGPDLALMERVLSGLRRL